MPSELPAASGWPWPRPLALCRAIYPQPGLTALRRRWRLAWQFWRHRAVHQRLRQGPGGLPWAELAQAQPRLFRKPYLSYPCAGWTVAQRAAHLLDHHRMAWACLGPRVWRQACLGDPAGALLGRIALPQGQGALSLRLQTLSRFEREGDLSLVLLDPFGTVLYTLTFSFEGTPDGPGLLIGAMHGQLPVAVARHLTRLAHGLRPQNLLLWALQQLAGIWGLVRLRAVGQTRHVSHGTDRAARVYFDYDGLWASAGGQALGDGFWALPGVAQRKAMAEIPSHKRAQYQRRYAWLDGQAAALRQAWEAAC